MRRNLIFDKGIYVKYKNYNSSSKPYMYWYNMLCRCYDIVYHINNPTYIDCFVCKEWLYFPNFCEWYDENYYEIDECLSKNSTCRMELDKDIYGRGNKEYAPSKCIFVPNFINALFVRQDSARIDRNGNEKKVLPIGVNFDNKSNKFYGSLKVRGKTIKSKLFNTPNMAFEWYKENKEFCMKTIADMYKDQIPNRLYWELNNYEVRIDD